MPTNNNNNEYQENYYIDGQLHPSLSLSFLHSRASTPPCQVGPVAAVLPVLSPAIIEVFILVLCDFLFFFCVHLFPSSSSSTRVYNPIPP